MMIYKIFIKHTSPIILGGRFLYTLLMSQVHGNCTSVHLIFDALPCFKNLMHRLLLIICMFNFFKIALVLRKLKNCVHQRTC